MYRELTSQYFSSLQSEICHALEQMDGGATFSCDVWKRTDKAIGDGGGGDTRVLRSGAVFESAGVNFSEVHGQLPADMSEKLTGDPSEQPFFACGVSLVLHPRSPNVPTTHANFRYLEVGTLSWFGGGMDLTPYYLVAEDAEHFHRTLKATCDEHDAHYYPQYKKWCDEYFYLPHRGETRGVGGLFFDYLGKGKPGELNAAADFVFAVGKSFLPAYLPIVERRRSEPYGEKERRFQLVRRGRYVEFNLIYDRGTLFGLRTNGRAESILMSLPPLVAWEYDAQWPAGSKEAELISILKSPREWC